ncbi:hypothetical protein Rctr197k_200 [Virus Rctr197k]|nr:hypothetical protein Rctr197k_200 [Virus Rctr197k]
MDQPPAPAFDLSSLINLLGNGSKNGLEAQLETQALVIQTLLGLLRDASATAREERAERRDLRHRLDKMTELLEASRKREETLRIAQRVFTTEVVGEAKDVFDLFRSEQQQQLEREQQQHELELLAALTHGEAVEHHEATAPLLKETLALDTPPDNLVPPPQETPKI